MVTEDLRIQRLNKNATKGNRKYINAPPKEKKSVQSAPPRGIESM